MENIKQSNPTPPSVSSDSDDESTHSVLSTEYSSIIRATSLYENHIEMESIKTNSISASGSPKSDESALRESTHNPLVLQNPISDRESGASLKTTISSDSPNKNGTPETSSPSDISQTHPNDNEIHNPMARSLSQDLESNFHLPEPIAASIADRIRQNRALMLAKKQPEQLDSKNHFYSYLTPDGLYQYHSEQKKFIAVLDQAMLTELGLVDFMAQATHLDENTELNLNDKLDIKQWQALENKVQAHNGFSTFGFSINEEVFLRFWGHVFQLGYLPVRLVGYDAREYTYPPRRDDLEKLFLNCTQNEWVQDVMISIRTGAQAQLLLGALTQAIFQFIANDSAATKYDLFSNSGIKYLLIYASGVALLSFVALHNSCIDRNLSEGVLHRMRLLMESTVGNTENWTNYAPIVLAPLAASSNSSYAEIMIIGFLLATFYGLYRGIRTNDTRYEAKFINMSKNTLPKVGYFALSYALTESSFSLLGINLLMNSIGYYHKNTADPQVLKQYDAIFDIIRYSVTGFIFSANLMRYPKANKSLQSIGMYACNIINGFSFSMLDSYSLFLIFVQMLIVSNGGNYQANPQNRVFNAFYFISQALTLAASLSLTFSNTRNLPIIYVDPISDSNSPPKTVAKSCKSIIERFNFFSFDESRADRSFDSQSLDQNIC